MINYYLFINKYNLFDINNLFTFEICVFLLRDPHLYKTLKKKEREKKTKKKKQRKNKEKNKLPFIYHFSKKNKEKKNIVIFWSQLPLI